MNDGKRLEIEHAARLVSRMMAMDIAELQERLGRSEERPYDLLYDIISTGIEMVWDRDKPRRSFAQKPYFALRDGMLVPDNDGGDAR